MQLIIQGLIYLIVFYLKLFNEICSLRIINTYNLWIYFLTVDRDPFLEKFRPPLLTVEGEFYNFNKSIILNKIQSPNS